MDKAQLLALADRVEALTGPDRGIDAAIHELRCDGFDMMPDASAELREQIEAQHPGFWEECGGFAAVKVPAYTSSLDAAMSLHPSEPWLVSMMHETGHAGGWRVELSSLANGAVAISDAGCDAAGAVTAASLRAMAGGDDGDV